MEKGIDSIGFSDESTDGYDAVVIGSGYGGSVAACRLSMAGIRVCLIEKGRRWEAQEFPTDSLGIMSDVRVESKKWGVGIGPKEALFQIHEQDDSLAFVACGLGGGSLINAGIMMPTPVRVRRDPKWPKEWQKDWEVCQSSASAMLGSQSIPVEFSTAKVMRQIAEEEIEECQPSPIKVSINFAHEEAPNSLGSQQMGSCIACGNCLSGCPYNAKNSTDKNYLVSAIQAGCVVKTECQTLYIGTNSDDNCEEHNNNRRKQQRKWRVYFDNLKYICADFVVLSAGVLGTTEILFHSKMRGLSLSEKLGFGFSCNGNNVAYVAGSQAPLNAYGLNKKQFSTVPFQDRPGPAISSSYTSSLGFTIQSGVLPTAYPYLLFKGIVTFGWPTGYWFLHGLIDKLKNLMGSKATQAMVLNVMGYDASNGRITLDKKTEKICFTPPNDPRLPRKIQALQNLTKRLGGILFMSRYRSTSVHLLGGCNAASDPSNGVCNHNGQVFDRNSDSPAVHEGLYVCDASLIPCSIGINPCLTIATAAEHVSRYLVQDLLKFKQTIQQNRLMGMGFKAQEDKCNIECVDKAVDSKSFSTIYQRSDTRPQTHNEVLTIRTSENVTISETMRGFIGGMPCTAHLIIKMNLRDQKVYDKNNSATGESHPLLRGRVGGHVVFLAMSKDKLYVIDGKLDMCRIDSRTPYTQYMNYQLVLASAAGTRFVLEGKKIMNPYLLGSYAWKESRTLHATFKTLRKNDSVESKRSRDLNEEMVVLKGELNVSAIELLKSFVSLKGNRRVRFVCLLLESLWRTYILQAPRQSKVDFSPSDMHQRPYPDSILHELKTEEDGYSITCRQWRCIRNTRKSEEDRQWNPVLLLNGYTIESYWLPTEPKDLVRTLLEEGHETWLLQPRLHPLHASDNFSIEDIGKFDIPAVIAKICELHGSSAKIHVIAHCAGGLAIHIALLGGHISATQIASLSCTNSSMFFKLTTSSLVKMRLPLIPISMAILGKNRILSMLDDSKDSLRHRLLKSIARRIPRYERCICPECEVLSGIFGNAFWHENLSDTMHWWLIKQNVTKLPMSGFPHLRKICNSGFIVDSNGENVYLIHPERMALPTLYISGGRSLLVTPETSFLANKYMRMHQPGFHHRRVVVDGFGHSDLLIGEESFEKVFPHFISHMRLAEQRMGREETKCSNDSAAWDGAHDGNRGIGIFDSFFSFLICLLLLLLLILFFMFATVYWV